MNPDISFRPYQRADLQACANIGMEVFPLVASRFAGEEVSKLMQAEIDSCYAISNYCELCVVDGRVVGLMFGRVKTDFVLTDTCQTLKRLLLLSVRFLLGQYGNWRKLIRLIGPCLQELRALRKNMPPSGAEIVLFAAAPKYQGIGIGRALMDRFVRYASGHKVDAISVPTDESASFWFYERYGFRRWAEFKAPLSSYCAGRPIKGFTYQILLHKTNHQG